MNKTTIMFAIILSFYVLIDLGEYNFKIIEKLRYFEIFSKLEHVMAVHTT